MRRVSLRVPGEVLVLERRELGGAAVTEEVFPGFRFSVFSYVVSLLRPEIIRELELPRHGLHILPLESTLTPLPAKQISGAVERPRSEPARARAPLPLRDAEAYDEFGLMLHQMARAVKLLAMAPPDPTSLSLAKLGAWRARAISATLEGSLQPPDQAPHHELGGLPRRVVRDRGAQGDEVGERHHRHAARPRSPGTAYVLLHHYMGELDGVFRAWGFARGGNGSVSAAIAAARAAGAEIRRSAPVQSIVVKHGRARASCSRTARRSPRSWCFGADPRRTFLQLVGEKHLPGEFVESIQAVSLPRRLGQGQPRARRAADFTCLPGAARTCAARSPSARASRT